MSRSTPTVAICLTTLRHTPMCLMRRSERSLMELRVPASEASTSRSSGHKSVPPVQVCLSFFVEADAIMEMLHAGRQVNESG